MLFLDSYSQFFIVLAFVFFAYFGVMRTLGVKIMHVIWERRFVPVMAQCIEVRKGEPGPDMLSAAAPADGVYGTWRFTFRGREHVLTDTWISGWMTPRTLQVDDRKLMYVNPNDLEESVTPGNIYGVTQLARSICEFLYKPPFFAALLGVYAFVFFLVMAAVAATVDDGNDAYLPLVADPAFLAIPFSSIFLISGVALLFPLSVRVRMRRFVAVRAVCVQVRRKKKGVLFHPYIEDFGRNSSWRLPDGRVVDDPEKWGWDTKAREEGDEVTVYLSPRPGGPIILPSHVYRSNRNLALSMEYFAASIFALAWLGVLLLEAALL